MTGFVGGIPKKAVPPKCRECGASQPMAVLREGAIPDELGGGLEPRVALRRLPLPPGPSGRTARLEASAGALQAPAEGAAVR
jgi:hypothetical protein